MTTQIMASSSPHTEFPPYFFDAEHKQKSNLGVPVDGEIIPSISGCDSDDAMILLHK